MASTRSDRFYDLSEGPHGTMQEAVDGCETSAARLAQADFPECTGGKWRMYVSMRKLEEPPEAVEVVEVEEVPGG